MQQVEDAHMIFAHMLMQSVYAALHGVLFESLLAENERRVRHLDGAVRHLEQRGDVGQQFDPIVLDQQMNEVGRVVVEPVARDLAGYGGPVAVMSFNPHAVAACAAPTPRPRPGSWPGTTT